MPSSKVAYATADEVIECRQETAKETNQVRESIAPAIAIAKQQLQAELNALKEKSESKGSETEKALQKLEGDCEDIAQDACKQLLDKIQPTLTKCARAAAKGEEDLANAKIDLTTEYKAFCNELVTEMCKNFEEEMEALKTELTNEIIKHSDIGRQEKEAMKKEVDDSIHHTRKHAEDHAAAGRDEAIGHTRKALAEIAANDKIRDAYNNKMLDDHTRRLDEHDELIAQNFVKSEKHLSDTNQALLAIIGQLRNSCDTHFDSLDREFEKLKNAINEVENVATKRVDWVIKNISQKIRPNSATRHQKHKSWFSPRFNMGGCFGLQLELQFLPPSKTPGEPGEEMGDCAVTLWGCKGTTMVYRVYIGEKYQTIEKTFNGRSPCGTKRFCFIKDMIDYSSDTLTLSAEVLESHRQVTVEVAGLEPEPEFHTGGAPGEKELDGIVYFHRHINNRLMEQVRQKADVMASRMVRRIDWRVEHASRLRSCFPTGEPLCSAQFTAAGIEGLQLVLYPSGYHGANEGYCSLFVYGPAGAFLSCALHLGPQQRDASNTFEVPGLFGCTNFCVFNNAVDKTDDSIHVIMDIKEAYLNVVGDSKHPSAKGGDVTKSSVKLQQRPGKPTESLEETRVLPSVWTNAFAGMVMQAPDGFKSFDALEVPKASSAPSKHTSRGAIAGSRSLPKLMKG